MFDIKDKVAIVTGGASGIGLATVEMILAKGGKPVIADYNEEGGKKEAERLGVKFIKVDVSKEEEVKNAVEEVVAEYGHLDIMVANAGINPIAGLSNLTNELYERAIAINQNGVFYCDKYSIEQMIKQGKGGAVINVSSVSGLVGQAHELAYNTTKFAVRGMTKSLALECAPHNIRVNSIHPSCVLTGMVNEDVIGHEMMMQMLELHPLSAGVGRIAVPEELAHAIVFAIENTFMTGAEVVLDGGWTVQ
ncbi:MAG: SDR family NAD(P)-dependent oxidoreductase [Oscillospiraceae bacterium]|nr:SDR family NAD(P)-dependent oxidoreductase [Oscillospiraceae bacterium]